MLHCMYIYDHEVHAHLITIFVHVLCIQSFFRNEKGENVTTHKSDVWSACATVMNVLIGKEVNEEAQEQV